MSNVDASLKYTSAPWIEKKLPARMRTRELLRRRDPPPALEWNWEARAPRAWRGVPAQKKEES